MTTSLHDAQASPATLLKAIRTYLTPIPNLSTLSSALTIFANFQLLSQRLQHEARRALSLNSTRISAKFEWGGLSTREIRWLNGLLQRNRCEGMRVFSAEIRRHHIAKVLSTPGMDYTRAKLLINSYYPDQVDNNPKLPLYIQCLDEDGFAPLAGYRSTSLQWLNLAKQNTREGLAPPKYEDFVGPGYKDKNGLELLARKLVSEAESVVKELDMFMAMSPGEEGSNLDELRGEKANPDPRSDPIKQKDPTLHSAPQIKAAGPLPPHPRRQTLPANVHGRSPQLGPSKLPPTPHTPAKRPRHSAHLPPSGPDYTAPIAAISSNIPKEKLKPFDDSRLKRPRMSEPSSRGDI